MASFLAKFKKGEKKEAAAPSAPATKSNKLVLLIIDPQNDFHPGGSLGVPGAIEDSQRTADFIEKHINDIDEIYVSLDTHHKLHIAHGPFWKNAEGESPAPFTQITNKEICDGVWTPRLEKNLEWAKHYTHALEAKGRYTLIIWPEHCIVSTRRPIYLPNLHPLLSTHVDWYQRSQCISSPQRCLTEVGSGMNFVSVVLPALKNKNAMFPVDEHEECQLFSQR